MKCSLSNKPKYGNISFSLNGQQAYADVATHLQQHPKNMTDFKEIQLYTCNIYRKIYRCITDYRKWQVSHISRQSETHFVGNSNDCSLQNKRSFLLAYSYLKPGPVPSALKCVTNDWNIPVSNINDVLVDFIFPDSAFCNNQGITPFHLSKHCSRHMVLLILREFLFPCSLLFICKKKTSMNCHIAVRFCTRALFCKYSKPSL